MMRDFRANILLTKLHNSHGQFRFSTYSFCKYYFMEVLTRGHSQTHRCRLAFKNRNGRYLNSPFTFHMLYEQEHLVTLPKCSSKALQQQPFHSPFTIHHGIDNDSDAARSTITDYCLSYRVPPYSYSYDTVWPAAPTSALGGVARRRQSS